MELLNKKKSMLWIWALLTAPPSDILMGNIKPDMVMGPDREVMSILY